jgi:hypothetical protein
MILLSISFLQERANQVSKSTLTVYDARGCGLYDFTSGGKSILVGMLSALKDPFFMETMMKSRWNGKVNGLYEFQFPLLSPVSKAFHHENIFFRKGNYITFRGKRIVIVNKPVSGKVVLKLDVDYLIVSGNPRVRLKELMTHFKTGKVILDASNPPWSIKAWMKEAHWLGLQCYSVSVSGAFREEF